jgi:steroid delta-isomerase-like uncharacterized protein
MADNILGTAGDFILAYDKKDWELLTGYLTKDVVYDEQSTERRLEGQGAVLEAMQTWGKAFPDSCGKITNAFASGNEVALEIMWLGTHTAPLPMPTGSIAASNKKVEIPAAMVFTFTDGKIKSVRHYFNLTTLLRQIGAA